MVAVCKAYLKVSFFFHWIYQALSTFDNSYIITLHRANLLTGEHARTNCATVLAHPNLSSLVDALYILREANLLTAQHGQTRFNTLIDHGDILLTNPVAELWPYIPHWAFTLPQYEAMIAICQNNTLTVPERQQQVVLEFTALIDAGRDVESGDLSCAQSQEAESRYSAQGPTFFTERETDETKTNMEGNAEHTGFSYLPNLVRNL